MQRARSRGSHRPSGRHHLGAGCRPNAAAVAAPAAYSWSGLYIGLNAGYAAAKVTETVTGGGSGSANIPAGLGGLQIGANVQTGAIVLGL